MNEEELLEGFGLPPKPSDINQVRRILSAAMDERQREPDCGNVDVLKLCCVQLFSQGDVSDSLLIWKCKRLSEEVGFAVDIQLLCGAGIDKTKEYLTNMSGEDAQNALMYITECQKAGDFAGFSPKAYLDEYIGYYSC